MSKTFGSAEVLSHVSFEVQAGEIYGLLGHNGSGKSTLVKILAGYHDPDPGSEIGVADVWWRSERVHGATLRERLRFVHQDLGLIPTLGAADNIGIVAGFQRRRGPSIDWRRHRLEAERLLAGYGLAVDVQRPVAQLSAGAQAVVAIARALHDWDHGRGGLLVVDEATAALHQSEAKIVNDAVMRVAEAGNGVLYISHRLPEVMGLCHRIGVLRDGELVREGEVSALSVDILSAAIAGREITRTRLRSHGATAAAPAVLPALAVRDLHGATVRGVSLEVRAGEIVGVGGLQGSGRDEFASLVFGASAATGGTVAIAGAELGVPTPVKSVRHGLVMVPAQRTRALVAQLNARENVSLSRVADFWHRLLLRHRREAAEVGDWMRRLGVRPAETEMVVGRFSGGNQQKLVLAKWLRRLPRVLLLDEPTQGVDAGAREAIYEAINEHAGGGLAVVVCSSDAEELARICDRVVVLTDGRVRCELAGDQLSEEAIVRESAS